MKKLVMMLSAMFLAVPMFALYAENEAVTVHVWNGEWAQDGNFVKGGVQDVQLTCSALKEEGSYQYQTCLSEDKMTELYVDNDTQDSAIDNEIMVNQWDKNLAKDGKLWVSVTITCPKSSTYVQIQKSQYKEDLQDYRKGYVREILSKTVEGEGFMRLVRRYKPEGEVNETEKKTFKMFDMHRLTRAEREAGVETDFTRFCAM